MHINYIYNILNGIIEPVNHVEILAIDAIPKNENDYASQRQLLAENKFFERILRDLTKKDDDDIKTYALKATTKEIIAFALSRWYNKQLDNKSNSYILISIKTNKHYVSAMDEFGRISDLLKKSGYDNVTLLNTIPAP